MLTHGNNKPVRRRSRHFGVVPLPSRQEVIWAAYFLLIAAFVIGAWFMLQREKNHILRDELSQLLSEVKFQEEIGNILAGEEMLNEFINRHPNFAPGYYSRGNFFEHQKEYNKAIADLTLAVELEPENAKAVACLGLAHKRIGDLDLAVAEYNKAIELDPESQYGYYFWAWLLACCPDNKYRNGNKAVELATKACELSEWKNPYHLDALSMAQAEVGNFDEAVKYEEKAIALLNQWGDNQWTSECETRLELFRNRKPYRELSSVP